MKQKYAIIRDDDQNTLVLREYAELDKEMMSLLCEETYSQQALIEATKEGNQAVINVIRTNNMYPPTMFAYAIAEAIQGLLTEGGNQSAELFFDDKDLFNQDHEEMEEELVDEVVDDVDVDDLLDDSIDDDFEDEKVLKDLKSSIQVADDASTDPDDGV
jgi:ankyrin repeat protein